MKNAVVVLILLFTSLTFAGFRGYQSTTDLGLFESVKCSTGLTCTKVGEKLNIVSSPTLVAPLTLENGEIINNTVDDTVEILSNDEHMTLQITGFEAKDAIIKLYPDQGDDNADKFSIKASAADILSLNNNGTAFMSFDSSGNATGAGTNAMSGFLQNQIAATATTLTAAQCGSTVINTGAVVINLPNGSAALLGCRFTFVTGNAANFDVNPGNSDQILVLTNAAGDAIRNATLGNSVVLQYTATNQWSPIGKEQGTYSDVN